MNLKESPAERAITPFNPASTAAIAAGVFPVLSIIGWLSGRIILASFGQLFIPMAPGTALCFIMLSLSLYLLSEKKPARAKIITAAIFCIPASVYGLLTFTALQAGLNTAPDNILLPDLGTFNGLPMGRMAGSTGLLIFLSGISLVASGMNLLKSGRDLRLKYYGGVSGAAVMFSGMYYLFGYALNSPSIYGSSRIPMAMTTSFTFIISGAGMFYVSGFCSSMLSRRFSRLRDLKIGVQLSLGITIIIFFVVLLGFIAYRQSSQIFQHTEKIYNHPLKVRRALGEFRSDMHYMRYHIRDIFIDTHNKGIDENLQHYEKYVSDAYTQLEIFYRLYLGPREDIDILKESLIVWNVMNEDVVRMVRSGKRAEAVKLISEGGINRNQAKTVMTNIDKIDNFAVGKADSLFLESVRVTGALKAQVVVVLTVILLFSFIIFYFLLRGIRYPVNDLAEAAKRFHMGDFTARSSYRSGNEFGILADSFNTLAEGIQEARELDEKFSELAKSMLSEYDSKRFFQVTLGRMSELTGSQTAAVYLLSDDRQRYEHYESVGGNGHLRDSFSASNFEGEFGLALLTHKVQHLRITDENTRFAFNTLNGSFIPREIITLPVVADNVVIAVISLASVNYYSRQASQLIAGISVTLSARIEGIIAYNKMKLLSKLLEEQNRELEAQKIELESQSSYLIEQNTELEMQKKQLDEASRLKTSFLSNMSHELRTPLNSVIALSGVLNRRLLDRIPDEEYSYLGVIERNGKHLLSLINDILDISRIEAGREELDITEFNVNTLVSELLEMLKPQAVQKKIELEQTGNDSDIPVISDAGKCRQILLNLAGNAIKFTDSGKVTVRAARQGDKIEIKVTDTGIGIREEQLSYIFDEFRQADGSASRRFGGTGLGLAIAKKYAVLLGGTITVKSKPGAGSEFTLILPAESGEWNRPAETAVIPELKYDLSRSGINPSAGSSAGTILLVEDSESAIIQIRDILEESGYRILVARNGNEALEVISGTIPDVMILDLMMPGVDGFEVLRSVREAEQTAHIPVLILTAKHITKEELKFLKRNNVHQYIMKGDVKREELLDTIRGVASHEAHEKIKPSYRPSVSRAKPLVLVVEDNPDNLLSVKALLRDDYDVIEAVNAPDGVTMAEKHRPDLILMDIALPGMDGIEAFKTIRSSKELCNIPVIALTASAMTRDRETILSHGFDSYITKPIDEKIFYKAVREILYGK